MVGKKEFTLKQHLPALLGLIDLSVKYQQLHKDVNEYFLDALRFINKFFPDITDIAFYLANDTTFQLSMSIDKIVNRKMMSTPLFASSSEGYPYQAYHTGVSKTLIAMKDEQDITFKESLVNNNGSYFVFPIEQSNYKRVASVSLYSPNPYFFDEYISIIFGKFAQTLGTAIESFYTLREAVDRSFRDELTGVYNRRFFFEQYEHEVYRHRRYNIQYAILMLDVDFFKKFNDTYGHAAGDQVLKIISNTVVTSTRKSDTVARYGGEEFIIFLQDTSTESAIKVAEKIRSNVENIFSLNLPQLHFLNKPITVSIGVATFPVDSVDKLKVIERADVNLYKAKTNGRNQVVYS